MMNLRFKNLLRERSEFSTSGEETLLSVSEHYGVKPRKAAFKSETFESRSESLEGYRKVFAGDLVMNYMLAWKGAYGISAYDGIVSPAYAVFEVNEERADRSYLHHRLRSAEFRAKFKQHSKGVIDSRLRLYPDVFLSLPVTLPVLAEQIKVARSLDRQISRIDAIVSATMDSIKLLRARRSGVIIAALNGQDSGDQHSAWSSAPIKHLFHIRRDMIDPQMLSGNVFHYSLPAWHEFGQGIEEQASNLASGKFLLEGGEILVSRLNPEKGAVIEAVRHDMPTVCSTEMIVLKPERVDARFGYYLMHSAAVRHMLCSSVESVTNSHKRARVDRFLSSKVCYPPLSDQRKIARFLDKETLRIDELIDKKMQSISCLREFRSSASAMALSVEVDAT